MPAPQKVGTPFRMACFRQDPEEVDVAGTNCHPMLATNPVLAEPPTGTSCHLGLATTRRLVCSSDLPLRHLPQSTAVHGVLIGVHEGKNSNRIKGHTWCSATWRTLLHRNELRSSPAPNLGGSTVVLPTAMSFGFLSSGY